MRRAVAIGLAGLLLIAVAGVFDVAPLYVPGVAFAVLGLLAPAWVLVAAPRATVTRELPVRRVVEEEDVPIRIAVRAGRLPLPVAAVEDPLLNEPLPLPIGARRHRVTAVARFARRGRRRLAPPALAVRDPLELARKVVRGKGEDELLVLPRTNPVALGGDGGEGARAGVAALLGLAATEVDGVRPYREGTPAARIHWPAFARGAGLMERRLRVDADARPLVVLDARGAATRADLDAAVRAAASLCLTFARAGGCALLLPGERRPSAISKELSGWPAAHVRLALVDAPPTPGAPEPPAPAVAGAGLRKGPVLYVAARQVDRLPPAVRAVARGPSALVVPGTLPGREAVFAVSGCRGYAVTARAPAGASAA
jgi:uncharacterized protein (DUF58 family)